MALGQPMQISWIRRLGVPGRVVYSKLSPLTTTVKVIPICIILVKKKIIIFAVFLPHKTQ
jgi:hypothetical protein